MSKLLLVDGNALMHRAYHAIPPFRTSKGIPTNVLYGFLSILYKSIVDFQPTHVTVCFDTPVQTFRNKLLESYQAQRPKVDDDFITQIPFVKRALDAAHIFHIEKDGFEADDVIGTITHHYKNNGITVFILSGDKDIMQLVEEKVFIVTPQIGFSKTHIYSPRDVKEKLGVSPHQIPDYKALAGDPSDNYIGAKGIGPKTAAKLLAQFETVDNLLSKLETLPEGKVKTILKEHVEDVELAHQLATIITDVPLEFDIKGAEFVWFNDELKAYLTGFEMSSIIKRIFERKQGEVPQEKKPKVIKEKSQLSLF